MGVASIEPMVGVVRFWVSAEAGYGDPYDWVATVRWVDPDTVEIVGITKPPTPDAWRAVKLALAEQGVRSIVFYRMRNGQKVKHELRTGLRSEVKDAG